LKSLNPFNPVHVWHLRKELIPYAFWYLGKLIAPVDKQEVPGLSTAMQNHLDFAFSMLNEAPFELTHNMIKHQLKLADRQCRIADMSERIQNTVIILVSVMWAHQQNNPVIQAATDILCQDLRRKLTGERPTDKYFRQTSQVADMIIKEGYPGMNEIEQLPILFSYDS
jgi:hypothetical protein